VCFNFIAIFRQAFPFFSLCLSSPDEVLQAWANTGGMQGYSGETKSPKGAAYHAIYELFNQHPPCSCPSQVVAFGSCNLTIAGCWYFPTADDVPNKHVVVKVTATDPTTGLSGSFCCSENNATALQDAAKSAIADLAKKENLAKCLFNQHTLNTAVLSLKKRIDETVVSLGQVDRSIARY
jgi:hypothetical protein